MPAVSDITRKAVWDTLCDLEWHLRYFGTIAVRRRRAHLIVRFALLMGIAVEGGILYGGTLYPSLFYVGIVGGLVLAGLTVWDALTNYAGDTEVCRMVASMCRLLQREADTLWRGIETERIYEAEVEATLVSIHSRWDWMTQQAPLDVNHSLNLASAETAYEEIINRYAS